MLQIIFYAFLAYILYKLVFGFIIPVYKTTRQVKRGFRQMQEQMRQYENTQHQTNAAQQPSQSSKEKIKGDYIDFEEIK